MISDVKTIVYGVISGLITTSIIGCSACLWKKRRAKKQVCEKVVEPPKTPLPEPLAHLLRWAKVFGKDRVSREWFLEREKQRVDEKTKSKQEELMAIAKEAAAKPTWNPSVNFNHPRLRAMMRPETFQRTADDFIREHEEEQKHKQ